MNDMAYWHIRHNVFFNEENLGIGQGMKNDWKIIVEYKHNHKTSTCDTKEIPIDYLDTKSNGILDTVTKFWRRWGMISRSTKIILAEKI